jgi:hypothetical protein
MAVKQARHLDQPLVPKNSNEKGINTPVEPPVASFSTM